MIEIDARTDTEIDVEKTYQNVRRLHRDYLIVGLLLLVGPLVAVYDFKNSALITLGLSLFVFFFLVYVLVLFLAITRGYAQYFSGSVTGGAGIFWISTSSKVNELRKQATSELKTETK